MKIIEIRQLIRDRKVEWRRHALKRILERGIKRNEVFEAIVNGEVIEEYPQDEPFKSYLIMGEARLKKLHVVLSVDENEKIAFIITVYTPSLNEWEEDFRTRRKK